MGELQGIQEEFYKKRVLSDTDGAHLGLLPLGGREKAKGAHADVVVHHTVDSKSSADSQRLVRSQPAQPLSSCDAEVGHVRPYILHHTERSHRSDGQNRPRHPLDSVSYSDLL